MINIRSAYSSMATSPASIIFWRDFGSFLSTVHPMDTQVPSTSLTVPLNSFDFDLSCMTLAISLT